MIRPSNRVVGLALVLGLATVASRAGTGPGPWKERPRKSVLATGIPLVYHKDASSKTSVVGLFVAGGKSGVPEGLDGLAYLTTRLALEIPDEGKVQDLMAQATRMNLVAFEDASSIFVECLSENLEEALRVAAKIIQDPLISGLRIGRAKEMMEIFAKAEDDDAVISGHNAALGGFFAGKGYGSATYGSAASRKAIERKDVLAFYRRFFTSNDVLFCVTTDLEEAPVRALLEKYFDRFEAGKPEDAAPIRPAEPERRDIFLERETRQTYVGRAFALPRPDPANQARGCLVEVLLGKGPGSRLWSLRSSAKLAYNVAARLTWTKAGGILEAYLETDAAKAGRASDALDLVLAGVRESGVTEAELEAIKTLAKADFLRSAEAKSDRTRLLGLFEVLGLGYDHLSGIFEAIESVTLDSLNSFLRENIMPERALRVTIGPAGAGPEKRGNSCPD